jgi:hypothetical protein
MRIHARATAGILASSATIVVILLGAVSTAGAVEPAEIPGAEKPNSDSSGASAKQIAEWVGRLGAESFQDRDDATRELIRAGREAIAPVSQAAESGDLEVAARCLTILSVLFTSPDEATRDASRAALEKLAASRSPTVSRRARQILTPPVANGPPGLIPGGVPGLPMGGRLQVNSRTTNGHTEVDVDENGTNVCIAHDGGRNITVTIQAPAAQGEQKPPAETKVAAADAAELKKKSAEASRYYEQYATGRPVAGLPGFGRFGNQFPRFAGPRIMIQVPLLPGFEPDPPAVDPPRRREPGPKRDDPGPKLQQMIERLKELGADERVDPERLQKLAEEIQALAERLGAAKRPVRK